ncbi:MAG TPA: ABC transporter permease [Anaerolineae bacterium]|jgi:ABC-type transport system involved in multi-copper enzyme maturation permease subunit
MNGILTIAQLTLHEARGRRVVLAALVLGLAFLLIFGIGYYVIYNNITSGTGTMPRVQANIGLSFVSMAGLYAVNFLVVMMAVLMPVDTMSGDIRSGTIQTLATKPILREAIVIGKWLAFWLILGVYLVMMAGGVWVIVRVIANYAIPNIFAGLGLIFLEATVLMTLSILGGTRLSTLANGVTILGLFGLSFIGGWMEQIGGFIGNNAAENFGVITSLLVPTEALWRLAAYYMQPPLVRDLPITPFSVASVPSNGMVVWAFLYVIFTLILALRQFKSRDL